MCDTGVRQPWQQTAQRTPGAFRRPGTGPLYLRSTVGDLVQMKEEIAVVPAVMNVSDLDREVADAGAGGDRVGDVDGSY